MILFVLWVFTSSFAVQVGTYPDRDTCVIWAGVTAQGWLEADKHTPRPFLYRMACVATMVPVRSRAPPAADRSM